MFHTPPILVDEGKRHGCGVEQANISSTEAVTGNSDGEDKGMSVKDIP